jgi:hypothetical protein
MSAPTAAEIISMGFSYQMFGLESEFDLDLNVNNLLSEHSAMLAGRIGATTYAATTNPTATYVKRSLKCLVAADLCQMRINRLAQEVKQEDGTDAAKMRKQRLDYLAEAEQLISKIETVTGSSNDFAFGTVVTSHFDEVTGC